MDSVTSLNCRGDTFVLSIGNTAPRVTARDLLTVNSLLRSHRSVLRGQHLVKLAHFVGSGYSWCYYNS